MKHQNDHIKFPSGNTIEFCRKKAKKLVKEKGIKLAQALDIIAEINGISGGWHNAMQQLNNNPQSSASNFTKLGSTIEHNKVGDVLANYNSFGMGVENYQISKFKTVLDNHPIPSIDAVKVGAAISKQFANLNNQHAKLLKLTNPLSSVISDQARALPKVPPMPAGLGELLKDAGAATLKLPNDVTRLIEGAGAAIPKLPDNVERMLKTVDALIPRELREYQKKLKQFEDVVNKPLSDLRK
ncbi:hypothetical protein [Aeromonas veronii]|uniref:hypothetical protein n=1 Tax=Aeromonas veronii TaxID=654 RepID=UPI003BA10863